MKKPSAVLALASLPLLLSLGGLARAQAPSGNAADHAGHHPPAATAPAPAGTADAAPLSEGEVRRLDPAQGKITLRHGPLANLAMPAMTMVFTAAAPQLLQGLQEGDKVRFTAEKIDGRYVVTAIRKL